MPLSIVCYCLQFLQMAQSMKISSSWKPVESGLRLSTTSILSLYQRLVVKEELRFLMSGRFSQDALENVFSQVRAKGVTLPKPVQFRVALRLIRVAQYITIPTTSNCDINETPYLVSFIKANKKKCDVNINQDALDQTALDVLSATRLSSLDICESNGFYYVAEWAVFKELSKVNCDSCSSYYSVKNLDQISDDIALLTKFKCYRNDMRSSPNTTNYLCHLSKNVLHVLKKCEVIFRSSIKRAIRFTSPAEIILSQLDYVDGDFPRCHFLVAAIVERLNVSTFTQKS